MEPTTWTRFANFVKESYTSRVKESFGGILVGFFNAQHLLFSGSLAHLVTIWWWVFKGVCTVILAFFTGLATAYASKLVQSLGSEKKSTSVRRKRNDKAA